MGIFLCVCVFSSFSSQFNKHFPWSSLSYWGVTAQSRRSVSGLRLSQPGVTARKAAQSALQRWAAAPDPLGSHGTVRRGNSGPSPKCFLWRCMPCAKCPTCDSLYKTVNVGYGNDPLPVLSLLMDCDNALISAQLAQGLSLWQRRLHQGKRHGCSETVARPGLSLIYETRPRSWEWTDWLARGSCTEGASARYGWWKQRKMNSRMKSPFPGPTYQHETSVSATVVPSGRQNYWFGEIAAYMEDNGRPTPPHPRLHCNNSL